MMAAKARRAGDKPRFQHRPTPRRQTTRRMAVAAAVREG